MVGIVALCPRVGNDQSELLESRSATDGLLALALHEPNRRRVRQQLIIHRHLERRSDEQQVMVVAGGTKPATGQPGGDARRRDLANGDMRAAGPFGFDAGGDLRLLLASARGLVGNGRTGRPEKAFLPLRPPEGGRAVGR